MQVHTTPGVVCNGAAFQSRPSSSMQGSSRLQHSSMKGKAGCCSTAEGDERQGSTQGVACMGCGGATPKRTGRAAVLNACKSTVTLAQHLAASRGRSLGSFPWRSPWLQPQPLRRFDRPIRASKRQHAQ